MKLRYLILPIALSEALVPSPAGAQEIASAFSQRAELVLKYQEIDIERLLETIPLSFFKQQKVDGDIVRIVYMNYYKNPGFLIKTLQAVAVRDIEYYTTSGENLKAFFQDMMEEMQKMKKDGNNYRNQGDIIAALQELDGKRYIAFLESQGKSIKERMPSVQKVRDRFNQEVAQEILTMISGTQFEADISQRFLPKTLKEAIIQRIGHYHVTKDDFKERTHFQNNALLKLYLLTYGMEASLKKYFEQQVPNFDAEGVALFDMGDGHQIEISYFGKTYEVQKISGGILETFSRLKKKVETMETTQVQDITNEKSL